MRDRYDDDYDDYDRYRDRQRYDNDRDLDDLFEMAIKLVFAAVAIFGVIYGAAWGIDHYLPFDSHLAASFNDWVKGLFDNIGSGDGSDTPSSTPPTPSQH